MSKSPFGPALRLLERGLINVQPLVAGQFSLNQGLDAFAAASRHLKILLEI